MRDNFSACTIDNKYIYVFGGHCGHDLVQIECYDADEKEWKVASARLPIPLRGLRAVAINKFQILITGGHSHPWSSAVYKYDVDT